MPKIARKDKDRKRRVAVKDNNYKMKIVRKPPPQKQKKVIVRQELVKDPKTGKAEYKDVYEVKDVKDARIDKMLSKTLYIPHQAPPKPFKYLRQVKEPYKQDKKKYPEPKAKYGTLQSYKKNRLLEIAKDKYDLPEKLTKKLDKEEIIDFINFRYQGVANAENKFAKTKVKLAKIEPVRNKAVKIEKSADPTKPYKKRITYGVMSQVGKIDKTAEELLNEAVKKNPKYKNIPAFGTYRKFDENIYNQFKAGNANLEDLVDELVTHLNIPESEKSKLPFLQPHQIQKMYNKAYKQSQKKEETDRYEGKIYMPKLEYQRAPNFAKAPQFVDYTGKPHSVASGVPAPIAYSELDHGFDYNEYIKPKEAKKLEKLEDRLKQTQLSQTSAKHEQDINDLYKQLQNKEAQLKTSIKLGNNEVEQRLKTEIKTLESKIKKSNSSSASSSSVSASKKKK